MILPLLLASSLQWSPAEQATIDRVRPSVATLADAGVFLGTAVLIGDDGRFLALRSATKVVGPDGTIATLGDGRKVRLFVDATDVPGQYVLLQARPWAEKVAPVKVLSGDLKLGASLIALSGPALFRAQVSGRERIGVDARTARMVPLTELSFESPGGNVGGAALFTASGEFAGAVAATLTSQESTAIAAQGRTNAQSLGPLNLIVGYSASPDVTRRTVEGFLSPARRPQLAFVGVLCVDAVGGGALVQNVDPGSPAERAGIAKGDVIEDISGKPIPDQIAFAKVLYTLIPGKTVVVRIRRGAEQRLVNVSLGR